jgi:tRNA A-37 threonylcarbamoyl transferase component Bud32
MLSNDDEPQRIYDAIAKFLQRAGAELIERHGPARGSEEWARLVAEHGANLYVDEALHDEALVLALAKLAWEGRKPLRPARVPAELAELYDAIAATALLRSLHARMGYEEPAGFRFDGFETHAVTSGGMGMVIKARDPELERLVAIKLWMDPDPRAHEALLAEAKILARLSHPNVVTIHATGRWRERAYFVMEWVEGLDGRRWLRAPRTSAEIVEVFLAAGEGLAAAHAANIQHRDFKPSNMLIGDDGRVVVADFGVADCMSVARERLVPEAERPPSKIAGTRCYIAPERLRRERGDERSDQFSFCVALWETLHGQRPYAETSRAGVLAAIERGEIQTGPLTHRVPSGLSRVVRRGLAADPEQRYANMRELSQALREELPAADKIGASASTIHASAPGRPPWAVVLGAMALGGLMVFAAMLVAFERGREFDRGGRDSPIAETIADSEADEQPCAVDDGDPSPDSVMLEECRRIRDGELEQANMPWAHEHQECGPADRRADLRRACEDERTTRPHHCE